MTDITSIPQAIDLAARGQITLLDVREAGEVSASGTAKGAVHIPLGLLPLKADPKAPDYDRRLEGKPVAVFCAAGARAARLAGMRCYGYAPKGAHPALVAEGAVLFGSMGELPAILGI